MALLRFILRCLRRVYKLQNEHADSLNQFVEQFALAAGPE